MKNDMKHITSPQFLLRPIATLAVIAIFFLIPTAQKVSAQFAVTAPVLETLTTKSNIDSSIQTTITTKEWLQTAMQQVAKGLAMQVLKKFTQETVNWINQGNDGKPLYVTNTGDFFDSIADEQVKILTNKIGYDPVNHPFGKDFLQYYITAYARKKLDPLATNTYTLPNSCATNFSWSCWNARVSNSANNPFGAFFETSRAIDQKINTAVSIADKEVSAAGGFLAVTTCELFQQPPTVPQETVTTTPGLTPSAGSGLGALQQSGLIYDEFGQPVVLGENPNANTNTGTNTGNTNTTNTGSTDPSTGQPNNQPQVMGPGSTSTTGAGEAPCAKYRNSTPGTVVGNQITTALSSGQRQNELAAALGSSVSAVFDALYNRFIGGENGLLGLATNELNDVLDGSSQQDTFNYYGVTLGQNNTTSALDASDWASGPDIIVDLNQVLGVPYTDGTTPEGPSSIDLTAQESTTYKEVTDILRQYPVALNHLDKCLPGPDYGWEARFNETLQEEAAKIDKKIARKDDENERAEAAADELAGIKRRVDLAILSIRDKMLSENIPSALTIYDTVNANAQKSLKFNEYYEKYLEKKTTLKRLEILKAQYAAGADIIPIMTQYQVLKPVVSRNDTLAQAESEKADVGVQLAEIQSLTTTCIAERNTIASSVNPDYQINSYNDGFNSWYYDIQEDNPFYPTRYNVGGLSFAAIVAGGPITPIIAAGIYLNNQNSIPAIIPPDFPIYTPIHQQNNNANYPAHMYAYCKSVIDHCPDASGDADVPTNVGPDYGACITLNDVFKNRNFEVSCFDFYNSNTADYIIGN
jgi:hypothetical protein